VSQEQPEGGPPLLELERLLADLCLARSGVVRERNATRQISEVTPATEALLAALEAYAAGLQTAGRPMPYRLRDELFLQRRLSARWERSPAWDDARP
jgi:hypothetical protein